MKKENLKTKKSNKIQNAKQKIKRKEVELSDEKLNNVNGGGENLLDNGLVCSHCRVEFVEDKKGYYIYPECGIRRKIGEGECMPTFIPTQEIFDEISKTSDKASITRRKSKVRIIIKK